MAKTSRKSATSKKLEALARSQRISELLKLGGIQSQALLDSAGETRPSDESHVVDLLSSVNFGKGAEATITPSKKKRAKAPLHRKKQKASRHRVLPKRKKSRR